VRSHKSTKEERDTNRKFKKKLRSTAGKNADWETFTMAELKRAIKKMKRKSAAGPDGIPPAFLKELDPIALTVLLKDGKPASDLASYRPISLTSCIVKLLERMSTTGSITLLNHRDSFTLPQWLPQRKGMRQSNSKSH